ncbi:argininosuccinate synthase [Methanogenium organophilum]|uniref:Argininosuccinate synthase n=1 Tax=Methanogenium organophilum TaxID=2199 RepID=A0A9X9S1I5_METOG|nr:argininosuccinate synthase [Methanogenium organophilum]WAI00149.1 argininosuccinate synthase [Methanogenium organophilum]
MTTEIKSLYGRNNLCRIGVAVLIAALLLCAGAAAGPTTNITVTKISATGDIIAEKTVDYLWMQDNLPVQGDGVTHYYHQGPVFSDDKDVAWDRNETANYKDHGAVMGTDIADLCGLVGGAAPGDEIMVRSSDGYHVEFPYENVFTPDPRQGPMVVTWYNGEDAVSGERSGVGYTPDDYYSGMRLIFFADNSTNADGNHIYGNWDMHETMPGSAQHFFDLMPSTNGFTAKWVDEVRIYEGGFSGDTSAPVKSLQSDDAESTTGAVPDTTPAPAPVALIAAGLALALVPLRRRL